MGDAVGDFAATTLPLVHAPAYNPNTTSAIQARFISISHLLQQKAAGGSEAVRHPDLRGVPEAPWVRILGQEVNVMLASLWTFLAQYGGGSGGNGGGGTGGGGGYSAGYWVVVALIAVVVLALVIWGIRRLAARRSSAPAADSNPRRTDRAA